MRALSRQWSRAAATGVRAEAAAQSPAALLALAYPERIAKGRGKRGSFLLANGRAGILDTAHPLAAAPYLVVAELQGGLPRRGLLAVATNETEVETFAADRLETSDEVVFDPDARDVRARRVRRRGAIALSSEPRQLRADEDVSAVLSRGIAGLGSTLCHGRKLNFSSAAASHFSAPPTAYGRTFRTGL